MLYLTEIIITKRTKTVTTELWDIKNIYVYTYTHTHVYSRVYITLDVLEQSLYNSRCIKSYIYIFEIRDPKE